MLMAHTDDNPTADSDRGTADAKREVAAGIYATWRNAHLNQLPVALFNRIEAAAEHLIQEIAAHL
jgi:hypothetical protein